MIPERRAGASKARSGVRLAFAKGYRVTEEGEFISPRGKKLRTNVAKGGKYPNSIVMHAGEKYGYLIHKLAAVCFWGEETLGQVVRHLDGDTRNLAKSNLMPGTQSENILDIPVEIRRATAKKARAAQWPSGNHHLTRPQVEVLRMVRRLYHAYERVPGEVLNVCAAAFDSTPVTVSRAMHGDSYRLED